MFIVVEGQGSLSWVGYTGIGGIITDYLLSQKILSCPEVAALYNFEAIHYIDTLCLVEFILKHKCGYITIIARLH